MNNLINAIEQCCAQQNWYAALYISLTMPDICSKLENPQSKNSGKRYRDWFDKYLKSTYKSDFHGPNFHFLTSGDCWALRCSLLHEGNDEIKNQTSREILSKFKFTTMNMHRCMVSDTLVLNVEMFCREMTTAVKLWIKETTSDKKTQERIAEMAKIETSSFRLPDVLLSDGPSPFE